MQPDERVRRHKVDWSGTDLTAIDTLPRPRAKTFGDEVAREVYGSERCPRTDEFWSREPSTQQDPRESELNVR
jgi:hypothetical protein